VNEDSDVRCPAPATSAPSETGSMLKAAREPHGRELSYIEQSPEKSVVLSPRLEQLIRQVGGCQTEQVAAVIQRVMYEILSQQKGRY
jgi:hypothetical protein